MTTPDERLRAIRWGGELLDQIATDASLPRTTIEEAARIAIAYPAPGALEERLQQGQFGLTTEWEQSLHDAFLLFFKMQVAQQGSEETRLHLRYTLRHFPELSVIQAASRSRSDFEWLFFPPKD